MTKDEIIDKHVYYPHLLGLREAISNCMDEWHKAQYQIWESNRQANPAEAEGISKLCEVIKSDLCKWHTKLEMSKICGIKIKMMERLFKKITGQVISEYIRSLRMDKAKELLRDGISYIKVGKDIGYPYKTSFERAFKLTTGISPKKYQECHS